MNWKPKKGVGKTLYAIDTWNYNFNSSTPYSAWTSDIHYPTIVKYTDVIIITNGATKRSTFIVAKKKGDTEYKTYKLKKINSINEDKQGVVLMRGQNIVISNDKKELFDYYKNAVHGMISWWEENKKAINQATLEFEVKDNYTYNRIKSNQDWICKISNIIGGIKDEYRIVANIIKSL